MAPGMAVLLVSAWARVRVPAVFERKSRPVASPKLNAPGLATAFQLKPNCLVIERETSATRTRRLTCVEAGMTSRLNTVPFSPAKRAARLCTAADASGSGAVPRSTMPAGVELATTVAPGTWSWISCSRSPRSAVTVTSRARICSPWPSSAKSEVRPGDLPKRKRLVGLGDWMSAMAGSATKTLAAGRDNWMSCPCDTWIRSCPAGAGASAAAAAAISASAAAAKAAMQVRRNAMCCSPSPMSLSPG